jgi:diphthamide synthase (EF-2-diphthine--ammonia ligase)
MDPILNDIMRQMANLTMDPEELAKLAQAQMTAFAQMDPAQMVAMQQAAMQAQMAAMQQMGTTGADGQFGNLGFAGLGGFTPQELELAAEEFTRNEDSTIDQAKYRMLALGAIYSEQQCTYINSLTTGDPAEAIKHLLATWWGIETAKQAKDRLAYLLEKGFRFYFPAVMTAYEMNDEKRQLAFITGSFTEEEDIEKALSQVANLEEAFDELMDGEMINSVADIKRIGVVGWDCGRIVYVARMCFDAGFLKEDHAWKFITQANEVATASFTCWADFGKSYAIGRALWGGLNSDNDEVIEITKRLLEKSDSPWVTMTW